MSILDKYGIKEVADLTAYAIEGDGKPGAPQLFLDTLKVSTIEETAESVSAEGGKGNSKLITWDFGKDITVSIQDALFSMKSLNLMMGGGAITPLTSTDTVKKTITFTGATEPTNWTDENGKTHTITDGTVYDEEGEVVATPEAGKKYFLTFDQKVVSGYKVDITPFHFPEAMYWVGDTFARSQVTGKDSFFQFVIPKGKLITNTTITMEAAGDPSVFDAEIQVLRSDDGKMIQLIQYEL